MRAFADPVDLVVYMLEKARAIAVLKPSKNLSDVVFGDHEILLCIREQLLARRRTGGPAPNLEMSASLVQYVIEAIVICLGDGHGAAPHPIFSSRRRGA